MNYGSTAEILSYDALGRTTRSSVRENGHEILRKNYTYKDIDASKTTTQLFGVSYVYNSTSTDHMYYYDANGNIITVKTFNSEREPIITRYSYNSLNELIWEYNPIAGKAWRYNYDDGGNILQKVEYAYVDGVVSGTGTVINYTYGDGNWKDKLTAYNGQSIIYDTIGNPTDYRGMTMSWQGGRQLAAVIIRNNPNTPNTTLSFEYNEAGLRTEKKVNNVKHTYYWTNGKLSAEICEGSYSLYFHYDANGDILGFSYKVGETTTEYYYVKNLQGDVLKVINSSGDVVAEYSYNAWGQILTSSGAMAAINPIRYRGYYYDIELGLYYLQSRYYDPEVGRFVNADDAGYLGANGNLQSYNLFVYCGNNPVSSYDSNGHFAIGSAVLIGAVVGGLISGISTYLQTGDILQSIDSGISGALTGAFCAAGGWGIGAAISGLHTVFTTDGNLFEKMIKGGANALTVGLIGWFGGLLTAPFEGYLKGFAEFMFDFEFGIASAIFDYTIQSALYRNEENVGFFSINPNHGESIKRAELHLCI